MNPGSSTRNVRPIICAIVPVQNEAAAISNVLRQLYRAGVQVVVVVVNGSYDDTPHVAKQWSTRLFEAAQVIQIFEPLGPDVPKAIGTFAALRSFPNAEWFVYVDGDWKGSFGPMLATYLEVQTRSGEDVQWVGENPEAECLPYHGSSDEWNAQPLWQTVLRGRYAALQGVCPSYGPLLIRRRTFTKVSPFWLHHPGLWFAECVLNQGPDFLLAVNYNWDIRLVGNPTRSREHARKMAETMFGDAVEGCRLLSGRKATRRWQGRLLDGYHSNRRTDILRKWQMEM